MFHFHIQGAGETTAAPATTTKQPAPATTKQPGAGQPGDKDPKRDGGCNKDCLCKDCDRFTRIQCALKKIKEGCSKECTCTNPARRFRGSVCMKIDTCPKQNWDPEEEPSTTTAAPATTKQPTTATTKQPGAGEGGKTTEKRGDYRIKIIAK